MNDYIDDENFYDLNLNQNKHLNNMQESPTINLNSDQITPNNDASSLDLSQILGIIPENQITPSQYNPINSSIVIDKQNPSCKERNSSAENQITPTGFENLINMINQYENITNNSNTIYTQPPLLIK